MRAVLLLSIIFIGVLSLSLVYCEETGNEEIVDFVFDASQNDVPNDDVPEDDSDVTSTIVTLEGKHVFNISDFKLRVKILIFCTDKEGTHKNSISNCNFVRFKHCKLPSLCTYYVFNAIN